MSKNPTSRKRVQDPPFRDLNRAIHKLSAIFYDDHCTIIQVPDPLTQFFAILHGLNLNLFSWQQDRLDSVGQFINIENFNPLQFSNPVKIKIVGNDWAMQITRQFHKFSINICDTFNIGIDNIDGDRSILLQTVEDLKSTTPTVATHRIG